MPKIIGTRERVHQPFYGSLNKTRPDMTLADLYEKYIIGPPLGDTTDDLRGQRLDAMRRLGRPGPYQVLANGPHGWVALSGPITEDGLAATCGRGLYRMDVVDEFGSLVQRNVESVVVQIG